MTLLEERRRLIKKALARHKTIAEAASALGITSRTVSSEIALMKLELKKNEKI